MQSEKADVQLALVLLTKSTHSFKTDIKKSVRKNRLFLLPFILKLLKLPKSRENKINNN